MMAVFRSGTRCVTAVFLLAVMMIWAGFDAVEAQASEKVLVFAAASTTNAVEDIGQLFSQKSKHAFVPSFASSSTLAKQIEAGAPANVYISANPKWMAFLDDKGLIEKGTRSDLLSNRIVFIAPAPSDLKIDIRPGFTLFELLNGEKLSMGDPDHVPAGIYGKQALESLGVWEKIAPHVVRAKDVRTALVFVERGEAPLGIVYATDAAISDKVAVVGMFPEESHPPITYQAGIVKGNNTEPARAFFEFLKSPGAKAIFEKYGFSVR